MATGVVRLTAYRIGAGTSDLTVPKIVHLIQDQIDRVLPVNSGDGVGYGSIVITSEVDGQKEYRVFETPAQVQVAIDPSDGKSLDKDTSITAAGSTQGNGFAIVNYYNIVDSATDTSAEALDLPAAVAGGVHVVYNQTAVALETFPASGETINGAAANAVYDHAAYAVKTYVCKTDEAWLIARES